MLLPTKYLQAHGTIFEGFVFLFSLSSKSRLHTTNNKKFQIFKKNIYTMTKLWFIVKLHI